MGSRKEEERNEKIIRGLMKLPPNRRCINCDSQGPQYVCTNFWTFICVTCSGIHREFTHRVKSVSMSKFSSQEVEALQRGGNQRAREIFLKTWDMQSNKLPSSSSVDRIREFIKSVYVDKRYAGGRSSDKPPRDLQSHKSGEEEHRRASSYHSFSQSPPYDHQYEDRLYGKQNHMLTRKPGSERALYDGKLASFLCSPGRKREETQEDRFANEGSAPRFSDFSVSSSGEAFGSSVQSPNFQRDTGSSEPPSKPIRDILIEDAQNQKLGLQPDTSIQRDSAGSVFQTKTEGSFGSSDGKTIPVTSATSTNLFDDSRDIVNPDGAQPAKVSAMPSQPSASVHTSGEDLFSGPIKPPSAKDSAQIVDLFAEFDAPTLPSASLAPVVDLFADNFRQTSSSSQQTVSAHPPLPPFAANEGWAQFDVPQFSVSQMVEKSKSSSTTPTIDELPLGIFPPILPSNNGSQVPSEQSVFSQKSTSVTSNSHLSTKTNDVNPQILPALQPWDAFSNSFGISTQPQHGVISLKDEVSIPQTFLPSVSSNTRLDFFEDSSQTGLSANQNLSIGDRSLHQAPSLSAGGLHQAPSPSAIPLGGSAIQEKKSVNPFDLPFESDLESSNMFMDMGSLHAALSHTQAPDPFFSNTGQSWLPPDHLLPYMNHIPSGYIPAPAPGSQLGDLPLHGTGAPMGGNPFAPQPPSPPLANLSVQGAGPSMSGNPFA